MTTKRCILVGLAMVVGISISTEALAQQPYNKRSISRPTLSPYLNQYRSELGIRDPYSLLSRPSTSMTNRTRQPTTAYGNQPSSMLPRSPEVTRNRDRILQEKAQLMIAPTGVSAGYMNMSHFYPVGRPRR